MDVTHRGILRLAALALAWTAGVASAQSFPDKSIRLVVAYVPGGVTDVLARALAQKLTENVGKPVVVDNRPGVNGIIAADLVMKAPADGYTLWVADTGHLAISPALRAKLPYDPLKDFTPITQLMRQDFFLVVNAAVPANTLRELVDLSKSRPGGLFYGSVGSGSVHHLGFERMKLLTGANFLHVPYKGNAQMGPSLLAGEIHMTVGSITGVMQQLKAGTLRALAIAASKRNAQMPDVPTFAESGVPGIEINIGVGLLAAAGTPREIVQRLRSEVVKAVGDPDLRRRYDALGFEIVASAPEEYSEKIRADLQQYRKIVSDTAVRAE